MLGVLLVEAEGGCVREVGVLLFDEVAVGRVTVEAEVEREESITWALDLRLKPSPRFLKRAFNELMDGAEGERG